MSIGPRLIVTGHGLEGDAVFLDVDILVDFAPGTGLLTILKIQAELEQILGVEVDLVPDAGLKDRVRMRMQQDLVPL